MTVTIISSGSMNSQWVSVPYSSGVALTDWNRDRPGRHAQAVSVPYSSGVALTAAAVATGSCPANRFQSPTHRELP